MATLSFKHAGINAAARRQNERRQVQTPPLGIVTPVREGSGTDGIFKMHRDPATWIKDNLRNLLMTNRGDRVIAADFGANLLPLTQENMAQEDFDSEAVARISNTVARYMPFIDLQEFTSREVKDETGEGLGRLDIIVTYNVRNTNITNQAIQVSFYLGG